MRMGVGRGMGMCMGMFVFLFPVGMVVMGMSVVVGVLMMGVMVRVPFTGMFVRDAAICMSVFPFVERVVCHGFSPVFHYWKPCSHFRVKCGYNTFWDNLGMTGIPVTPRGRSHNMKIGELAQKTGTPVETIRYYEKAGLLPKIGRTDSNYRVYTEAHVERLLFIRHCRSLDMTLDEIRVLLHFKDRPEESCDQVNALLDEHIGHVAERIRELKRLEKQLRILRESCRETRNVASCGILNALSCPMAGAGRENGTACTHVHPTHGSDLQALRPKTD